MLLPLTLLTQAALTGAFWASAGLVSVRLRAVVPLSFPQPVMPVGSFAPAWFGRLAPVVCPFPRSLPSQWFKGSFLWSSNFNSSVLFSGACGGASRVCSMSSIYFGGSRNLQSPYSVLNHVVGAVVQSGQSVHVGCCIGADALVITSALLWGPSSLVVFAISAQSGQGACSLSSSMPGIAAARGVPVHWLAGGSLSVPLAGRLINRSIAALAGCSAAVFFQPGPGSLAVAAHAVSSQIPVFAFGNQPARGQWVQSSFMGFACWQWQAAQLSLF